MHPPIGGGISTDFKSSNRIKISRLVQILLHFYWFGVPHPPGGWGWVQWVSGELGMMWGPSRWCEDDMGMTGTTWGWRGWHGDHGDHGDRRPRRPQPWGPHGDLLGAMGMTWGWWGWQGWQGWHGWCGDDGDDVGMTGTRWGWWGRCGDDGDNEITKNAITFERIEIIEFHLKIWDPWTLPTHVDVCSWGSVLSQMAFLSKKCSGDPQKKIFPVFALDPITPYLDWALRRFLTSWPIYDPLKSQPKWQQSAKFD